MDRPPPELPPPPRLRRTLLRPHRDRRLLMRAEEALRRSEASLRQVLEAAPDAIGVHREGRFIWCNARQAQLFGFGSPGEMVGRRVVDQLHPEDRAIAGERIQRMHAEGGAAALREMRVLRLDGTVVSIEVASLAFEYGGAPAILSITRDVTERKLIQNKLLQADRLSAVGKLAAGVAHEINNPLSYVIANVGLLQAELPELSAELRALHELVPPEGRARLGSLIGRVEEAKAAMADAAEGAERVRVIVRDLKTFSRPDLDSASPVDVRRVLESSINLAWNEIRHRARLSKQYDKVPLLEANESRLGQVFLNLLLHAAQSIPEGERDRHEIRVHSGTDAQGRAEVAISHSGQPIDAGELGRVFDPFANLHSRGTGGLALSVCHGIVSQLGGEISVDSAPGGATTFRVALPVTQSSPPSAASIVAPVRAAPRARRVLVVDDEPAVGSALRRMLSNHDVVTVQSGRAAVSALQADSAFDVVLCDLMMPEMTGMDVHDEVARSLPGLERRMVFMTGGVFTERARDFLLRVPNPRLEKPFSSIELKRLVAGGD